MPTITLSMVLSAVRWIITVGGGILAAKGVTTGDVVTAVSGEAASVVSLIWSLLTHQQIALTDVASTIGQIAGTVATATTDGQTKAIATQVENVATDVAKGNIS